MTCNTDDLCNRRTTERLSRCDKEFSTTLILLRNTEVMCYFIDLRRPLISTVKSALRLIRLCRFLVQSRAINTVNYGRLQVTAAYPPSNSCTILWCPLMCARRERSWVQWGVWQYKQLWLRFKKEKMSAATQKPNRATPFISESLYVVSSRNEFLFLRTTHMDRGMDTYTGSFMRTTCLENKLRYLHT